jgi:penicillin-binding protein-related factor A (putative recombinase)
VTKTKNTGGALEALVRKRLPDYKAEGLALEQNSPRFAGKVGPRGKAQGRLVSKGGLDFSGHFWGRAVTFDCKSTEGKSFPLNERNVKPHQARRLREAHEMGAIAFFLVEFSELAEGPRYFVLDWPVLAPYWEAVDRARYVGGKAPASIPLDVFKRSCTAIVRDKGGLDLVAVIAGMAEKMEVKR